MPSYFDNNRMKQKIDDEFDLMSNMIKQEQEEEEKKTKGHWIKQTNGYHNANQMMKTISKSINRIRLKQVVPVKPVELT